MFWAHLNSWSLVLPQDFERDGEKRGKRKEQQKEQKVTRKQRRTNKKEGTSKDCYLLGLEPGGQDDKQIHFIFWDDKHLKDSKEWNVQSQKNQLRFLNQGFQRGAFWMVLKCFKYFPGLPREAYMSFVTLGMFPYLRPVRPSLFRSQGGGDLRNFPLGAAEGLPGVRPLVIGMGSQEETQNKGMIVWRLWNLWRCSKSFGFAWICKLANELCFFLR